MKHSSCETAARLGSGGELGLNGNEPRIRPPAAPDQDLVTGGGPFEVVAEVVAEDVATDFDLTGSGARGTRTPDPLHAMQVLSQLSYSPSELKICRKVNARALAISWR
jgi:hypothetical protein